MATANAERVKVLETVKTWADTAFGLLCFGAIGATVYWVWTGEWRPTVTLIVLAAGGFLYCDCVDSNLKSARGG